MRIGIQQLILLIVIVIVIIAVVSVLRSKKKTVHNSKTTTTGDIEKLTKLKEMYDKGLISQEEFETKKKQLLGR